MLPKGIAKFQRGIAANQSCEYANCRDAMSAPQRSQQRADGAHVAEEEATAKADIQQFSPIASGSFAISASQLLKTAPGIFPALNFSLTSLFVCVDPGGCGRHRRDFE